jgi:hypothetical protein
MNNIMSHLYLSVAVKNLGKVISKACLCVSINHKRADLLHLYHLTKPSLSLSCITKNFRADPAEAYEVTGRSSYNPHRGTWQPWCSAGRSREAVSFLEFNLQRLSAH